MTEGSSNGALTFVQSIMSAVTGEVSLTMVATVIAAIIAAGIIAIFAWKFARKGYRFVVNALSGRSGKM